MKVLRVKRDAYDIYKAGMRWKKSVYNEYLDDLIKTDKEGYIIFLAGKDWKSFNYDKGLRALKNTKYYRHALEEWPKGIEQSISKSKKIKAKAKTLPMKKLKLKEDIDLDKMSVKGIYEAGKKQKNFDYEKGLDALIKRDIEGLNIYWAGVSWKKFNYEKGSNAIIKKNNIAHIYYAGRRWKKFDYEKGLEALKNTNYYRMALKYWPKDVKQSQIRSKEIKAKAKVLPMKTLKLEATMTKIEDFERWARFLSIESIIKFGKMERPGFDYIKAIQVLYKKMNRGGYDVNIIRNKILNAIYKEWPEKYFKSIKIFMSADSDLKWMSRTMIDTKNLHKLRAVDIYLAGKFWKNFDYEKGLDALIKKDAVGLYIYQAGVDWKEFNYEKGLKALRGTGYYDSALETWTKNIKQSQAISKEIKDTSKKLPMKTLKLEGIKTPYHLNSAEDIYNAGLIGKDFNYKKGLDELIKKDKDGLLIYYAGQKWKTFDYDKGLDALIEKDKKGLWIWDAGFRWKKFDYDKGLDALIRNKAYSNIFNAGTSWKKFNYKKGLDALKNSMSIYYKHALKHWPKNIKQSIKISKDIKKKAKTLPMKKLKLEDTEIWFPGEIYYKGCHQKDFDFEKGLDDLIKADETGEYIYDAGFRWREFDFKKALDALIKVSKKGKYIYHAGRYWEKFDYKKGLKALKKISKHFYKKALEEWPRGVEMSQIISKDIKDKAKVLHMKPLRLKEEAFTEIQYLNKSFFYDLKRVFRAVKKMDKPEKTKRLGFYLQALRKIQGNQKNIDRIIRDVFEKKQELSPESVINKLKVFETPAGKKLYVKPETAYQTTQRLVSSQKLNKTISVSIFGEIYDSILDKYKNKPGGDDIIRSINRYISGHFTDAAAFIRWTNMSKDWTHIDAFQTDFFSKIKAMGNQDENFKKVADEIRAKEDEYWKTAMSYILRTNPDKKVWTANTEDLVKAVENVRGEVKLKQYYYKLPKLLGFKLITMDKLKQILRTRPGEETEKKITTLEKAVGRHIKPKTTTISNYKEIIDDMRKAITKIAQANKNAADWKHKEKITKQQIDVIINSYARNDELASAFHQHLDGIHDSANKGTEDELSNYLGKLKPHIVVFLKNKAALSADVRIWWANRELLFEMTGLSKKNLILEKFFDELTQHI